MLGIVVPTLDAVASLAATLASLNTGIASAVYFRQENLLQF